MSARGQDLWQTVHKPSSPTRARWVFLWTSLPLLILYAATRARTVTGEDSGELISAAYELGIAHPPGYPLWLLITKLFQIVCGGLNPADAASLSCAVTTACAMGVLAVLGLRLTRSAAAAVSGAWIIGVGHEIWNHATIAEVYPLNLLILVSCLVLFQRWLEQMSRRRLFWLAFLYGLGLTHHPTFQLFLPVFGLAVILCQPSLLKDPKGLGLACAGLLLPFVVYIQVLITAGSDPFVTWGVEPDLPSVLSHYMREVYWGGVGKSPMSLAKLWGQAVAFGGFHARELTIFGWGAGYLGLVLLVRRNWRMGSLLLAIVALGSFGMLPLMSFDLEREEVFANRVFLLPAYLVLGVGITVTISRVLAHVQERRRLLAAAALLVLPLVWGLARVHEQDRSDYFWAQDYGKAILSPLPRDCVLIPGGDTSTFPLIYLQRCEGFRKDILILDRSGTIEREQALEILPDGMRPGMKHAHRDNLVEAVIRYSGKPVVVLKRRNLPGEFGLTLEPFGLGFIPTPSGDRSVRKRLIKSQEQILKALVIRNERSPCVQDLTADIICSHLAQVRALHAFRSGNPPRAVELLKKAIFHGEGIKETFNNVGAMLAEYDVFAQAEMRFRQALAIRADYRLARQNLIMTLARQGKRAELLHEAELAQAIDPSDEVAYRVGVEAALTLGLGERLKGLCEHFSLARPNDPRPHRMLARWALEHDKSTIAAAVHLEKALELDPQDEETRDQLRRIEGGLVSLPEANGDQKGILMRLKSSLARLGGASAEPQTRHRRRRARVRGRAGNASGAQTSRKFDVPNISFPTMGPLPDAFPAMRPARQSPQVPRGVKDVP